MKDLQENTKEIPCSLDSFDIKTEDSAMLKLRKFRTCLNLLTSRLSSCLDDGSSEKVMAEINDWLSVVKDQALIVLEQVKTGEDEETDKMAESVKSGLLVSCTIAKLLARREYPSTRYPSVAFFYSPAKSVIRFIFK